MSKKDISTTDIILIAGGAFLAYELFLKKKPAPALPGSGSNLIKSGGTVTVAPVPQNSNPLTTLIPAAGGLLSSIINAVKGGGNSGQSSYLPPASGTTSISPSSPYVPITPVIAKPIDMPYQPIMPIVSTPITAPFSYSPPDNTYADNSGDFFGDYGMDDCTFCDDMAGIIGKLALPTQEVSCCGRSTVMGLIGCAFA